MNRYLIFSSLTEFNTVNNALNVAFGYPNEGTKTVTYATPVGHPSNGNLAMAITEEAYEHLTLEQQTATITSLPADWVGPSPMEI